MWQYLNLANTIQYNQYWFIAINSIQAKFDLCNPTFREHLSYKPACGNFDSSVSNRFSNSQDLLIPFHLITFNKTNQKYFGDPYQTGAIPAHSPSMLTSIYQPIAKTTFRLDTSQSPHSFCQNTQNTTWKWPNKIPGNFSNISGP